MRPLILITNDDGVHAKGIHVLANIAREFGDVVVMAPEKNSSGKSHSLSTEHPLRMAQIFHEEGFDVYYCNGTPVDCIKLASEHCCPRRVDLVLSGINHGSNASVNVLYSGTMGAVIEASNNGYDAIGFSLLDHALDANFDGCIPCIRSLVGQTLEKGLPEHVSLNVNIPNLKPEEIKGMLVCKEAQAKWSDSFEKRIDPLGRPYFWLTGNFICDRTVEGTDEWALANGYISIVPTFTDFTCEQAIEPLKKKFNL